MTHPFSMTMAALGAGVSTSAQAEAREQAIAEHHRRIHVEEMRFRSRRDAIDELENILYAEFRRAVHSFGREIPIVHRVELRYDEFYDQRIIHLDFFEGRPNSLNIALPREMGQEFGSHLDLNARFVNALCRRVWSRAVEDHLLDIDLDNARRTVDALERLGAPPDVIEAAYACYRRDVEHIRRNHARRHSPIAFEHQSEVHYRFERRSLLYQRELMMEFVPPRAPDMTATEVRARQEEADRRMSRLMRQFGEAVDAQFMAALQDGFVFGGPSSDVGTPEAQARGIDLLKANLTPEQLAQYEQHRYFEVVGGETGTRYRIRHGRQMNVDKLDREGQREHGLCFLPQGNLVAGDCMLAQKTALECFERKALKVANKVT